jgi:RNA polymerase sigma-70 factor (ECF subfamily)
LPGNIEINQLVDHLFRHESGKLVALLTGFFGPDQIQLAEDVVQDSLIEAINQWSFTGVPNNPSGWLYKVAKNKAINHLNRLQYGKKYAAAVKNDHSINSMDPDDSYSEKQIVDDQLRMMFICCHPINSTDSQIALTLKTLCGFSIPEIARAFLSTDESIHKRLVRARQKIRDAKIPFELPSADVLHTRCTSVLQTIYFLFNEGYSASSGNELIRFELCSEAIRLSELLTSFPAIAEKSDLYGLLALMHFNASRFHSRMDTNGQIIPMSEQDRSKWDQSLIQKGFTYLAGNPTIVSAYRIMAAISAHHCSALTFESTNWSGILSLYDHLLSLDHSPVVILNRSIAVSKVKGPRHALTDLETMELESDLDSYYLFHASKAELHAELHNYAKSIALLEKAIELAPMQAEKDLLLKKLESCKKKLS